MYDEEDDLFAGAPSAQNTRPASEPRYESEPADESIAQNGEADEGEGVHSDEEDSEDDVEIIMEPTTRSMDFRQQPGNRHPPQRTAPVPPKVNLTTEYTPRERESTAGSKPALPLPQSSSAAQASLTATDIKEDTLRESSEDTTKLPPATAPPSAPPINPAQPGTLDGRSLYEVDISALADKPWRRPGSDLSDWFNYGFDEISWEAYCFRRREMGEVAPILKVNVLTFAGMPEEQVNNLPQDIRGMVIGQSAAAGAGVSGPGVSGMLPGMPANGPMNPAMSGMMHPEMMMGMGMGMPGPQGMGIVGGEMSNGNSMQAPTSMMQGADIDPNMAAMEYAGNMMGGPGIGMEYGMQDPTMQPHMYNMAMEQPPIASVTGVVPPPGPRAAAAGFRGRVAPQGPAGRGARGAFGGRGRGRGMPAYDAGVPPPPVRAASPLPPGVPTGPRNQNRYKDRDGTTGSTDGLDYGGGGGSGPAAEEAPTRKRRGSPGDEGGRSKRR